MEIPPPVLAGQYVVAFAHVDASVAFEQRHTLNVGGEWLGRVPYLAVCQEFETAEFTVQHCGQGWEPLGIAAGYRTADEAKRAVERSYQGLADKWVSSTVAWEDARAIHEGELKEESCSFCGRTPLEVTSMVGEEVRICKHCVDSFHRLLHRDDDET